MIIERKEQTTKEISTSSLPDIIFLLLVFFMVVTVMKEYDAPKIDMPYAKAIKKLENRRNAAFVWATKDGYVVLDDLKFSNILQSDKDQSDFKLAMKTKMGQNPQIIVSLKSDNQSKMLLINNLQLFHM